MRSIVLYLLLSGATAHAEWKLALGKPDAADQRAAAIYAEAPSGSRLSWLHPQGKNDLLLMFSIPGKNGIQLNLERLSLKIDQGTEIEIGRQALTDWRTDPQRHPYPMTANGQLFSWRAASADAPARYGSLLRQMMDGESLRVRYYLTTGHGMDVRFPLAGLKPLVAQYFGVLPNLEDGEEAAYLACSRQYPQRGKPFRACLGRFADQ
ncbi:hypothetical protein [Chitinimonas sp.]|uniref:hypothetical protein n=1 Tax=Chitinimonas sp. TaxID=1934313 RepID=UPI0035AF3AC5